eukprot:Gb_25765 [translate_table: standard]
MEEQINRGDLLGNVVRPPSLRVSSSLKATLSGRLTPRNSPSFRRSQSSRTPRKEAKLYTNPLQWIRGQRLLPWLMMIGVWSYLGFHIQSKWAHDGEKEGFTTFGSRVEVEQELRSHVLTEDRPLLSGLKKMDPLQESSIRSSSLEHMEKDKINGKLFPSFHTPGLGFQSPLSLKKWFWKRNRNLVQEKVVGGMVKEGMHASGNNSGNQISEDRSNTLTDQKVSTRNTSDQNVVGEGVHITKGNDHSGIGSRAGMTVKGNHTKLGRISSDDRQADATVKRNTTFGFLVGPFDRTENRVLGWNAGKRYSTCDRKGLFAQAVRGRSFIVVLHELSMTGAPLAMMELAAEILSCGGRVSAIALSKKGGLMEELTRRGIKVLKDKTVPSYRVAMKADLVIAGSAVSASWIEQYLVHNRRGASRLVWWIMENRREYFDRSKHMLQKVKALLFLSELQSQQWLAWCEEEGIALPSTLDVVPLSVNDELAFVAGLQTALNSPLFSVEKMLEKRRALRDEVRRSMGLDANDMLVMTLSSINPGKGQLILLEAALMIDDKNLVPKVETVQVDPTNIYEDTVVESDRLSRVLSEFSTVNKKGNDEVTKTSIVQATWNEDNRRNVSFLSTMLNPKYSFRRGNLNRGHQISKVLADPERNRRQTLKLLIGSVGSKSNKVLYIKKMLGLVAHHSKLARLMLWTPATIHVAPLYAAADVYVINAQGVGETFGRVTIEAMSFSLPVLGTDAGGTREIVEDNVTGLLHPVGQKGIGILSQHIRFLLDNPSVREEMGLKGREKVEKLFLKHHMYDRFAGILKKCMRYV